MQVPTKLDPDPDILKFFSLVGLFQKKDKCQKDKNGDCSQSQGFWDIHFILGRISYHDPMKVPTKLDQNPHIPRWFSKSGPLLWLWSTFVTICKKNYKCQKDKNWKCSQSQSFWATDFLLCMMFYCDPGKVPPKLEQNPDIFHFFQIFWDFSI